MSGKKKLIKFQFSVELPSPRTLTIKYTIQESIAVLQLL